MKFTVPAIKHYLEKNRVIDVEWREGEEGDR